MIRVGDRRGFQPLAGGEIAPFLADRSRTVRIKFNAPYRTVINTVPMKRDGSFPKDAEPEFLAVVDGLDEVEFRAHGPFGIQADADVVYFQTADGETIHVVVPDAQTFTRISERRARNPEVERLQEMLQRNLERRMKPMFDEMRKMQENAAREPQPDNRRKSADTSGAAVSEPDNRAGKPAASAKASDVGKEAKPNDTASSRDAESGT